MTIPNALTIFRLLCVPFVVWLGYSRALPGLIAAAAVFAVAAGTDWLDGYLARRSGKVSTFGTLMDPLVDKVLILSVLLLFVDRDLLPLWIVLLIMFRELLITAIRHSISTPRKAVGANWSGKTKFALQVLLCAVACLYLVLDPKQEGIAGQAPAPVFWLAVAVTTMAYYSMFVFIKANRAELVSGAMGSSREQ